MVNEKPHTTDQDLLLLAEGELPARRAAHLRQHLATCWDCRTKLAEIEGTIVDFMRMHRERADRQLPPSAGPRGLLKARLAELAQNAPRDPWRWLRVDLDARTVSLVVALTLISTLGAVVLYWQTMKPERGMSVAAGPLPDPHLTPGVTTAAAISDICSMNHDVVVRPVPSMLQQTVFREYGMRKPSAGNYEIDFLISPGLGGAEDLRNLWPEPRYNTVWNSFVKDQLEDYLHQSVCSGRISLATAQQEIANNWISAYQKYFRTREPLAAVSGLSGVESLTIHPTYGAPDRGKAGHGWIARAKATRVPFAYRTMNIEPSGSQYTGLIAPHEDIFIWN